MSIYAKKPILSINDEEYKMLIEVTDEFKKQKSEKTAREKSGDATETIVRRHLQQRRFNLSTNPNVKIRGSNTKNDLLLLKEGVDPNKKMYEPNEVKVVLEIKNNAVGGKRKESGEQEDPNNELCQKFNDLEQTVQAKKFAVVVLSETLLPPRTPYKWRYNEEAIGKSNCKVFTLIARQGYPKGGLYLKSNIVEMQQNFQMKKTEEFQQLIDYLKSS